MEDVMNAAKIRQTDPVAGRSWDSREGIGEQIYELTKQVQEVAAQLADLNESHRPAAQAQEPQAPASKCNCLLSLNQPCPVHDKQPALVEQEADRDVVDRMSEAYVAATLNRPGNGIIWKDGLYAAYDVARQYFAALPPEGWHSTEQVKTATEQAAKYCNHMGLGFGDIWEEILYGLTPPQKPVERVTIQSVPCDIAKSGTRYNVLLDGELQEYFYLDTHAERYAAGLRLELADKGERHE
jgi:hypothetical protein